MERRRMLASKVFHAIAPVLGITATPEDRDRAIEAGARALTDVRLLVGAECDEPAIPSELHRWEAVTLAGIGPRPRTDECDQWRTERLPVPGGWLYLVRLRQEPPVVGFVPDPTRR